MSKSREDKNIDELKASVAQLRTAYLNAKSRISELTAQIDANEERLKSMTAEFSRLPEYKKKAKKGELTKILEATRRLRKLMSDTTGIKNNTGRMLLKMLKTLKKHSAAGQRAAAAAAVVVDDSDDDGDDSGAGAGAGAAAVLYQQRTRLGCMDCPHPEQCSRCKAEERAAKKSANRSASAASLEDSDSGAGVAPRRQVSPKSSAASNPKPVVPLEVAMAVAAPASTRSRSQSPKRGCWPWCRKKSQGSQGSRSRSKSPSWWKKHFSRKNKDVNPPPTGGRRCKTNKRQKRRGTLRK
jgi:hypothetical protein